ncbi:MAG: Flp pilus assembly protein CpaB [Halobacteriovoraceae bacterium]|nr:Flp pilus assembly protein CpaB [Halobacteriovoraceae bacterium]|tara:strand:- start:5104 stop:5919 length:816 start_codon:yes stop_codon:yes gene_type:complete
MNNRAFTLSLLIAGIAIFMVSSYIDGREADFKKRYGDMRQVVIASEEIQELETIDSKKLKVVTVPGKYVMPDAFTKIEDLNFAIASTPIKPNEQITPPRVSFPNQKTGLARQVSQGKRAFSVAVSEDQAVGKLIKPGDRVDILAPINYGGGRIERSKVKTVIQDVYVLATGKRITREVPLVGLQVDDKIKGLKLNNYTDFNNVTLELSPYDVQKIIFLTQYSSGIYLSLRSNNDKNQERIGATSLFDVLGEDAEEARQYFEERRQQLERRK